ncbi:18262_t:CDS:1, partial [Cetraspora pellucida]
TEKHQQVFDTLKNHLISDSIFQYSDFSRPFYLHTDASTSGLGAVLSQLNNNYKEYIIAYASRSLNNAKNNYPTTDLECLAIVWAIEHFYQYFGAKSFFFITNHSALQWLRTFKLKERRARW